MKGVDTSFPYIHASRKRRSEAEQAREGASSVVDEV